MSSTRRSQLERAEAIALVRLAAGAWWSPFLHHSPNEEMNATARQLAAAQGTRPGFPDYVLVLRAGNFAGLAFEMKAPNGAGATPAQRAWLQWFEDMGWKTDVCHGADVAYALLRGYTKHVARPE